MNALSPEAKPQPPTESESTTLVLYNPDPDILKSVLAWIKRHEGHRFVRIQSENAKILGTVSVTFKKGYSRQERPLLRLLCQECENFPGTKVEIE